MGHGHVKLLFINVDNLTRWTWIDANSAVRAFALALVGGLAEGPDDATSTSKLDPILRTNLLREHKQLSSQVPP